MNADEVGAVSEACPGVSESVCYSYTSCGCYDGACGWEQTPEFLECLDDPPPNPVQPGCIIDSDCNVGGICGGLCYSPSDYVCEPGEICEAPPEYVPCVGSGTEVCYGTYGTCGCSAGACGWEPSAELDECLADPPVCVATPAGCNCFIDADCARAGCSSELCVSAEDAAGIVSTCDYKDWYNCLPLSSCGCNAGKCAWDQNEEYLECLADPPSNAIECMADSDCEITGCLSDSGTCVPSSMVEEIEANCEHWGGLILPGEVCGCNGGTCGWTSMPEGHTAD
jgi:eight-cysteine-cluster-containing protein